MILFKLRSLDNLDRVADLLVFERLYYAPWHQLNDPMEGYFDMSFTAKTERGGSVCISTPQNICTRVPDEIRVCSLSSDISDVRLWAYYGGAQSGIAVEIDFTGLESALTKVEYDTRLKVIDTTDGNLPEPREILSRKTHHWSYESEYRIITKERFVKIDGRIRRVIVGRSCPDAKIAILRRLLPAGTRMGGVGLDPSRSMLTPYDI